jgi:ATP-dependent exoDNAse (exonuclease V) beta subunit
LHYAEIWKRYFDELFTVVGYLPMYDLLSEIYKQFRLFEMMPEEEGALAKLLEVMKNFEESGQNNLKAFLSFADDEADATEWNISVPQGTDAVSVMTIHKAKGLGNRVVVVLLVDSKSRSDNLFVEESDTGVRLVHITKDNAAYDESLQAAYRQHRLQRSVDDLNKLYVACTRAKEEMYIISEKSDTADEPSKFLPSSGFEPKEKPMVEAQRESLEPVIPLFHSSVKVQVRDSSSERLALYERRRGEIIHDVLSHVEFADENIEMLITGSIKNAAGNWVENDDVVQMKSVLLDFLRMPDIAPFFTRVEGRKIMTEQEFVHPDGRLFRMDRIVVDHDMVTVLDFKTGEDKEAYTDQVQGYMNILQNYFNLITSEGDISSKEPRSKILTESHPHLPLTGEGILSLPLIGGDESGGSKYTKQFSAAGALYTIHGILAFVDRKKLRVVA